MKNLLIGLTSLLILFSCKKDLQEKLSVSDLISSKYIESTCGPNEKLMSQSYAPNEIIVKFKNGKSDEALLIKENSVTKEFILTAEMKRVGYTGLHVLKVPDVDRAVQNFRNNPNVEWVNPNYVVSHGAYAPDDPYYPNSLWGLGNIKAPTAWNTNIGDQKIYIGVIDEGIMYWHEDLCGQIWTNPYETENGIDDDGNGYIDDIHGWDFYNNNNTIFDDVDDHGTHVSGTIGAIGNNGKGVVGVSPNVTIISGKFLEGSGYTSDAIKAVDYMTDLKTRHGMNIAATSNSWGGGGYSQGLYDAINRAKTQDILFVAAAGNDGRNTDITANYPSCFNLDNIISVAAYNSSETLPSWTNYGVTTVDIGAPGVSVYSTLPGTQGAFSYGSYSGTSMATPHVSGAVALYKAGNPTATYTQVRNAILNNARPISALNGKCVTGGVLNIETFTTPTTNQQTSRSCSVPNIDYTSPTAPTNLTATSTSTSITPSWSPSTDNVGVTGYNVFYKRSSSSTYSLYTTTSNTSVTISGLLSSTSYDIYVTAKDANNNTSPASSILTKSTQASTISYTISTTLTGTVNKKTQQTLTWSGTVTPSGYSVSSVIVQWLVNNVWTDLYNSGVSLSGKWVNNITDKTSRTYRIKTTLNSGEIGYSNSVTLTSK